MVDSLTVDTLAITINDWSTKAKPYQDVIEFNVSANIQLAQIAIFVVEVALQMHFIMFHQIPLNFSNFLSNRTHKS